MIKQFTNATMKQREGGFTLIEILVSTAILAVTIVSVCGIYLTTVGSQRKVGQMANILQDVQFVMENLVKNIRTSEIDYGYTYNIDGDSGISGDEIELALKDSFNPAWHLYYKLENNILYKSDNAANWYPATMSTIKISSLKFYIYPSSDPFSHGSTANEQARVTVVMTMKPLQSQNWLTIQQTIPQRFTEKK